jgi:LCP family protein required for cell wall assembly
MVGVGAVGALVGLGLLSVIWQEPDRAAPEEQEVTAASLADKPRRAVTVLVIGSDADTVKAASNGAAPAGPPNADALVLVRVNPDGPLQVLNLPVNLAVMLPGESEPQRLGALYRKGGVALVADAVKEVVGLPSPGPDRYLVMPRGALRQLVSDLGGLEVSPPRTMRYRDKTQNFSIDLQSGLQRLDGQQVEQMARFRNPWLGESGRRLNHELLMASLRSRLGQPEQLIALPALIQSLQGKVETNLSLRETLSLLAAGLDDDRPIDFASLPLRPSPPEKDQLRQLEASATPPLWEAP